MPDTLSISLTPGYLPTDGELIDNSILRLIARPSITLTGSIGSATISDGAVTTAKLADGALSADTTGRNKMADAFLTAAKLAASQDWSALTLTGAPSISWTGGMTLTGAVNFSGATFTPPAGMLTQQVHTSLASASTITATIPVDNTIPQNSEGTELITLAITPKSATNILEIEVVIPLSVAVGGTGTVVAALFQDTTADGLAVAQFLFINTGQTENLRIHHRMVAGTTSATTFKVRVGTTTGTITINGAAGATLFGGISAVRMFIKEITA